MLSKTDEPGSRTISQSSREHREQKRAQEVTQPCTGLCTKQQASPHRSAQLPPGTALFLMQSKEVAQETTDTLTRLPHCTHRMGKLLDLEF